MMISAPPYYVSARITTAETRMRLALDCREQRRNAFDKKKSNTSGDAVRCQWLWRCGSVSHSSRRRCWSYCVDTPTRLEPTASNSHLGTMNAILLTECCLKMPTQSVHNRSLPSASVTNHLHQLLILFAFVILSAIVCLNCCSILTNSRVLLYSCVLSTAFYRINEWMNEWMNAWPTRKASPKKLETAADHR